MMISSILAILTLLPIIIETYISIYFIISLLIISVNIYMLHHARNAKHYEESIRATNL